MSYQQPRSYFTPVSGQITSSTHGSVSKNFHSQGVKPYNMLQTHQKSSPLTINHLKHSSLFLGVVSFCFVFCLLVCLFVCLFLSSSSFRFPFILCLPIFFVFEAKMSARGWVWRRCRTCISFLLSWFPLQIAEPVLPYALAFAAGAMVYVVVDDIIPEAQTR